MLQVSRNVLCRLEALDGTDWFSAEGTLYLTRSILAFLPADANCPFNSMVFALSVIEECKFSKSFLSSSRLSFRLRSPTLPIKRVKMSFYSGGSEFTGIFFRTLGLLSHETPPPPPSPACSPPKTALPLSVGDNIAYFDPRSSGEVFLPIQKAALQLAEPFSPTKSDSSLSTSTPSPYQETSLTSSPGRYSHQRCLFGSDHHSAGTSDGLTV